MLSEPVPADEIVFLLDVDNTLLDNDRFGADLGERLEQFFGKAERERYWQIFADRREQLGLADYLGSLQSFRNGLDDDPKLLGMSAYLLEYPFSGLVYPGAGRSYYRTVMSYSNRVKSNAPASGMPWPAACSFTCTRKRC